MTKRLKLISAVIDVATSEQPRPMREFLKRPRLPIREMYLTRLIINLVYFARNYLNFILLFVFGCAFCYPLVVVVLAAAGAVHLSKRKAPHLVVYAKIGQAAACVLVTWVYGWFCIVTITVLPMMFVASHAAFVPYTDEAMIHYEDVMEKRGFSAPAPRSPTRGYEHVDKMFAEILLDGDGNKVQPPYMTPRLATTGTAAFPAVGGTGNLRGGMSKKGNVAPLDSPRSGVGNSYKPSSPTRGEGEGPAIDAFVGLRASHSDGAWKRRSTTGAGSTL